MHEAAGVAARRTVQLQCIKRRCAHCGGQLWCIKLLWHGCWTHSARGARRRSGWGVWESKDEVVDWMCCTRWTLGLSVGRAGVSACGGFGWCGDKVGRLDEGGGLAWCLLSGLECFLDAPGCLLLPTLCVGLAFSLVVYESRYQSWQANCCDQSFGCSRMGQTGQAWTRVKRPLAE